jgi:hypothetical protein
MSDIDATFVNLRQKFDDLKHHLSQCIVKSNDLKEVKKPKISRKEALLEAQKKGVLSKEQLLEQEEIQDEERIENICMKGIKEAKEKYDSLVSFYNSQAEMMKNKSKRMFESKRRNLDIKQDAIRTDMEMLESNKTTAEYTLDRQIREIGLQMKDIIIAIYTSTKQLADAKIIGTVSVDIPKMPNHPILNEIKIPEHVYIPIEFPKDKPKYSCPCRKNCPLIKVIGDTIPRCLLSSEDMMSLKRQQLEIAEEKRERREQEEERERKHQEHMVILKAQQESDVKRQDERRRKELEDRERLEQLEKEVEEELEEERRQKEQEQPPLTPFQGLPPPDPPRERKARKQLPTKAVPIIKKYATPVEII